MSTSQWTTRGLFVSICLAAGTVHTGRLPAAELAFRVSEQKGGDPLPCRIHLNDSAGKPHRPAKAPFFRDHFVCPGIAQLEVPPGSYSYEIERGPEYISLRGSVELREGESKSLELHLGRITNLTQEGWWSGELHVHRPVEDVELLMRAEDLHITPVITWWNNRNLWRDKAMPADPLVRFDSRRFYHQLGGEDEREGGALLFFGLKKPLSIAGAGREFPSPMRFVEEARRQPEAWIDIEKPFWWDVPVWVALAKPDSIGLANNHMCRSQMLENEAWGKPRVVERFPAPRGNGLWSQEIYYHLLNCGLRIPPSAGSASGVLPNPVGYNRVYVHLGEDISYEAWWQGLRAGRSFVTNGPLLRARANGHLPGHVFTAPAGADLQVKVEAKLTSRDPIPWLEIVQDGTVVRKVAPDEVARTGSLGTLHFQKSGWFLVRAIADVPHTFRFASTAPYYVEVGEPKRTINSASAQFFLNWGKERVGRVKIADEARRKEVLRYHEAAERFWQDQVNQSKAQAGSK